MVRRICRLMAGVTALSVTVVNAGEPGRVAWFDLVSEDAATAGFFYAQLFDWEIVEGPTGKMMVLHEGVPIAGISDIDDNIQNVDESQWVPAIEVGDVSVAVENAVEKGGAVEGLLPGPTPRRR